MAARHVLEQINELEAATQTLEDCADYVDSERLELAVAEVIKVAQNANERFEDDQCQNCGEQTADCTCSEEEEAEDEVE